MSASRARRDAAVRLLVECLLDDPAIDEERVRDLLGETSVEAVVDAATFHGVAGLLHHRLRGVAGVPKELAEPLKERYDHAVRRHLQMTWELAGLRTVLDGSGVDWAVIKGPAAAELLYHDPGLRPYDDIDVVVEPARFDDALAALREGGIRLLDRNWTVIRRDLRGELHLLLPGGTPLDLHWHLVNMYRGRMRIDTAGMLRRAVRVDLGGVPAPTLDATDSMIHLALHGTLAGGDRLRWMKDVALATTTRPPDWVELVRRADAWNVSAPVGFMLERTRGVLHAAIPDDLPPRLLGYRYGALVRIADRISPWERARGRLTTASLLLARSMGLGPGGAAGWLVARTFRNLDPREPEASSNFTPRGDDRDFEAFVRAVVDSGRSRRRT